MNKNYIAILLGVIIGSLMFYFPTLQWKEETKEIYNHEPIGRFDMPVPYIGCFTNGIPDGCVDFTNCIVSNKTNTTITFTCFANRHISNDNGRGYIVYGLPDNPSHIERLW